MWTNQKRSNFIKLRRSCPIIYSCSCFMKQARDYRKYNVRLTSSDRQRGYCHVINIYICIYIYIYIYIYISQCGPYMKNWLFLFVSYCPCNSSVRRCTRAKYWYPWGLSEAGLSPKDRHRGSRQPPQGPAWPWENYLRDVRVFPLCRQGYLYYCRPRAGLPSIHWRDCLPIPDSDECWVA